jgi:predicted DNA-binding protein (UPF0251 family)
MGVPKGKGRKANAKVTADAFKLLKLVDVDLMDVEDAAKQCGLTRSTAYRLLSRARSAVLAPQVEADKKAAEPNVRRWFEPISTPEPPVEVKLPDVKPVPTSVQVNDEVWPWEHLMSYTEFQTRTPHRQKQLIAQWEENVVLGGKHALTLRGGPKNKNCFRGCPSYECLCEDNL